MSQEDVYKIFVAHPRTEYTRAQITKLLNKQGISITGQSVNANLRQLSKGKKPFLKMKEYFEKGHRYPKYRLAI